MAPLPTQHVSRRRVALVALIAAGVGASFSVSAVASGARGSAPPLALSGAAMTTPPAASWQSASSPAAAFATTPGSQPATSALPASSPTDVARAATPSSASRRPVPGQRVSPSALPPPVTTLAGLDEDLQYLTGSTLTSRLDQYAAIGAKVARFQMIWDNVQHSGPGSYDWTEYDDVISGLLSRGILPLPVIDTTPAWARTAGCSQPVCAPADPATYAAFAGAAAARYGPEGVHNWEIWNEPNNPRFWQPAPSSAAYTSLLTAAYAAIHHADAAARVITGGVAPAATVNGWIAPVEFLSDIYADGGGQAFDAVGWHPYDYPRPVSMYTSDGGAWQQMAGPGLSARSVMTANGDAAKQIWATEFGAPTCTADPTCETEAQQAADITAAYALWRTYSWAGPLVSYMFQDRGTDQANREDFFGFVRFDGTLKPAYASFRAVALA